jgi:hypothetical protein
MMEEYTEYYMCLTCGYHDEDMLEPFGRCPVCRSRDGAFRFLDRSSPRFTGNFVRLRVYDFPGEWWENGGAQVWREAKANALNINGRAGCVDLTSEDSQAFFRVASHIDGWDDGENPVDMFEFVE